MRNTATPTATPRLLPTYHECCCLARMYVFTAGSIVLRLWCSDGVIGDGVGAGGEGGAGESGGV